MTLDDVVPHPQHRMCHSRTASAPPAAVWDELCRVTMSALPLGYALEGIRLLPSRLAGRSTSPWPDQRRTPLQRHRSGAPNVRRIRVVSQPTTTESDEVSASGQPRLAACGQFPLAADRQAAAAPWSGYAMLARDILPWSTRAHGTSSTPAWSDPWPHSHRRIGRPVSLPTTRVGSYSRVAPARCRAGAPSEPCVPLIAAHGSSKPRGRRGLKCSRATLKIRFRSRRAFCSWARQSMASHSGTSSGPFTVTGA